MGTTADKGKTLPMLLTNFEKEGKNSLFVGDFLLHPSRGNFGEIRYLNGEKNSSVLPALTRSQCAPLPWDCWVGISADFCFKCDAIVNTPGKMSQQRFQRWLARGWRYMIGDTGILGKAAQMTSLSLRTTRSVRKQHWTAAHQQFLTLEGTRDSTAGSHGGEIIHLCPAARNALKISS